MTQSDILELRSKRETLAHCWFMLGQSLRRWPTIKPTLGQRYETVTVNHDQQFSTVSRP